jgi:hypothetical protein
MEIRARTRVESCRADDVSTVGEQTRTCTRQKGVCSSSRSIFAICPPGWNETCYAFGMARTNVGPTRCHL